MKKDPSEVAFTKVWFQNRSLRYTESECHKCNGIFIPL